jgi:hypothetical protein
MSLEPFWPALSAKLGLGITLSTVDSSRRVDFYSAAAWASLTNIESEPDVTDRQAGRKP